MRNHTTTSLNLITFAATSLVVGLSATASAAPLAASVASAPLNLLGILVGVLIMGLAIAVLVRSFGSKGHGMYVDPTEALRESVRAQVARSMTTGDRSMVSDLIDAFVEVKTEEERRIVVQGLREISGRYFGADATAWRAWWARECRQGTCPVSHVAPRAKDSMLLPVG